jgi:hypothetical protein
MDPVVHGPAEMPSHVTGPEILGAAVLGADWFRALDRGVYLAPGRPTPDLLRVPGGDAQRIIRQTARSLAQSPTDAAGDVVWVAGANELLVSPDRMELTCWSGTVTVMIPVACDQLPAGPAGSGDGPAGPDDAPSGPGAVPSAPPAPAVGPGAAAHGFVPGVAAPSGLGARLAASRGSDAGAVPPAEGASRASMPAAGPVGALVGVARVPGPALAGAAGQSGGAATAGVTVVFGVGTEAAPAGLIMSTLDRPIGPAVVVEGWADALTAFAWAALVHLAQALCAATGRDSAGQPLVPAYLSAGPDVLLIQPMARHVEQRP